MRSHRRRAGVAATAFAVLITVLPALAAPFPPVDDTSTTGVHIQTVPGTRGTISSPTIATDISDNELTVIQGFIDSPLGVLDGGAREGSFLWSGIGYPFWDIGCQFCETNPSFSITDINSSGQVAGWWESPSGARLGFVWSEADGFATVGTPPAGNGLRVEVLGIDEAGNIAGIYSTDDGGICGFGLCGFHGELSTGDDGSFGWALNPIVELVPTDIEGGVVVGGGFTHIPPVDTVPLPLGEGHVTAVGNAINTSGGIAGRITNAQGDGIAAYWSSRDSAPVEIGTLPGDIHSNATSINDLGQVVGWSSISDDPDADRNAFFWDSDAQVMIDLGTLPEGATAAAWDINNEGLVAGTAAGRAVIWDLDHDYDIDYPPTVEIGEIPVVIEGDLFHYQPLISDLDGDPYTVTWAGLPEGAAGDSASGLLSWQTGSGDVGNHVVTMTVTQDGQPQNQLVTPLSIRVAPGDLLDPIGDQLVTVGVELTFTATSSATQPIYSATSGAPESPGPLPAGAQIGSTSGLFKWTPDSTQIGDHQITITVEDLRNPGVTDSETIIITVVGDFPETVVIAIDETIAVHDDTKTSTSVLVHVTEGVAVTDSAVVRPPLSVIVTENIEVADSVAVHPPISILVIEDIEVADEAAVAPALMLKVLESVGVTDAVVAEPEAPAGISGLTWEDIDGDGARDPDEGGIEGVVVYLDMDDDGSLGSGEPWAASGADGSYSFSSLAPGEWIVREVVPESFIQTFPDASAEFEHRVLLAPGENATGLDFGNQPTPDLPPTIEPLDDVFGLVGQPIEVTPVITDPEGDPFSLTWQGAPPNAVINGIFVLEPTAEQGDSLFEIAVTATQDDNPDNSVSETFRIFVAALPAVQHGEPEVNPAIAPAGGAIQVGGTGFQPGSSAGIYLFSEPLLLDTVDVAADGTFSTAVILPGVSPGPHQVVVMGVDPDGNLRTLLAEIQISDDGDGDGLSDAEEGMTGTDPTNPDSDGDNVIDGIDASWLIDYLDDIPRRDFRRGFYKPAMKLTVLAAAVAVNLGERDTALYLIESLGSTIDGCGSSPDRNDWITDCDAQIGFRQLLSLYERNVAALPLPDRFGPR